MGNRKLNVRLSTAIALLFVALLIPKNIGALQGGPTMPEYMQFEPRDVPDVVNLTSGDFTYSIPLTEVSGPYGGFPLSMSYHAGITPAQEATWVGLGWTLNPGAINRNLRGAPDDQFHGGDLAYIYSYSLLTNWSVNFGLSYGGYSIGMSYDNMSGYGVSAGIGIGQLAGSSVSFTESGTVGLNVSVASDKSPVGLSGGITFSSQGVGLNAGVTASVSSPDQTSVSASVGVQVSSGSKVSFSSGVGLSQKNGPSIRLSSSGRITLGNKMGSIALSKDGVNVTRNLGNGASVSVGAVGMSSQSSSGGVQSSFNQASLVGMIPLPGGVVFSFGYSRTKQEWWVREATEENIYGYMYQAGPAVYVDKKSDDIEIGTSGGSTGGIGIPWNWNMKGKSLERQGNPNSGDLSPAYDIFNVASDGMSGTFRTQAATEHTIFQSAELLEQEDKDAQVLFYLLNVDPETKRQYDREFDVPDTDEEFAAEHFTDYAYDWCYDQTSNQGSYEGIAQDQEPSTEINAFLAAMKNDTETGVICSKYAVLRSTHLNEANRLVLRSNLYEEAEFQSRITFRFMGEASGYYANEAMNSGNVGKYGQDEFNPDYLSAEVDDKVHPLLGSRKIEPILEGNSSIGRLQGFKITREDGSQYFYTQPVRTIMNADYTTNRYKGMPLFVDKKAEKENFIDLLEDAFKAFAEVVAGGPGEIISSVIGIPFTTLGFVGGAVDAFLFGHQKFTNVCSDNQPDEQYNFSYNMKTNPYATQWLLTEVRGPEFVLLDEGNMENNIGYQAKLHYDEPRMYQWRFPFARPGLANDQLPNFRLARTAKTPSNCNSEVFHGSFGVKELVYLNKIETATHEVEFVLNDDENNPDPKQRIDAKGWIQDLTGRNIDPEETDLTQIAKTAMPIYVNTTVEAEVSIDNAQWPTWYIRCSTESSGPTNNRACWYEREVDFTADKAFLNVDLTDEQRQHILDDEAVHEAMVTIGGLGTVGESEVQFPGQLVNQGFTLDRNLSGSTLNARVVDIESSILDDFAKGTNALVFNQTAPDPVPIVDGFYRTGAVGVSYSDQQQQGCSSVGATGSPVALEDYPEDDCHPVLGPVPDDNVISMDPVAFGDEGGVFGTKLQPQLIFNDFVSFNRPKDHTMAYLDEMVYRDKATEEIVKKYEFEHDYLLQPKTVNSYEGSTNLSAFPPDYANNSDELKGKLTLLSVQEVACLPGTNCQTEEDEVTLPPFRFEYKDPGASTFREIFNTAGAHDWDSSIIASTVPQDEWGFWNELATFENKKVNQDFADKGGTSWSLHRITDPLGGVMEVDYERDEYRGEWYGQDEAPLPVTFRRCGDEDRGVPRMGEPIPDPEHLCIDFVERKWVTYCNKSDLLRGEWVYDAVDGDLDYVDVDKYKEEALVFYQLNAKFFFEVACGPGFGSWRLSDCDRDKMTGVLGSGRVVRRFESEDVTVPYLDDGDGNPVTNANTLTIELDVFYKTLKRTLHAAAQDFIKDGDDKPFPIEAIEPSHGVVFVKKENDIVEGGDIRVRKLVKKDMGLVQTTEYHYEPGEMPQYPDSVLSTGFAQRFAPVKVVRVMASASLPSMSRVPGITDDELIYLPQSKVYYPKVTVINTLGEGNDREILNGKTEYEFFTSEQGIVVDGATGEPGFLKMKLRLDFDSTGLIGSDHRAGVDDKLIKQVEESESTKFRATFLSDGVPIGGYQDLEFIRLSKPREKVYVLDKPVADADVAALKTADSIRIEVHYAFWDGDVGAMTETSDDAFAKIPQRGDGEGNLINDLGKFSDVQIGVVIEPFWTLDLVTPPDPPDPAEFEVIMDSVAHSASVNDIKSSANKPFLVRTTPQESEEVAMYDDFQGYLSRPKATTYFRWRPDPDAPDDKNMASDPNDQDDNYIIVKKEEMHYSPLAPSADTRLDTDADVSKIGVDRETWQYERRLLCDDPDDPNDDDPDLRKCNHKSFKNFEGLPKIQQKEITMNRYAVFTTGVTQSTGFNNSDPESEEDFIVTRTRNYRYDPVTGQPTLTVTYSGPEDDDAVPAKAVRLTPAYMVGELLEMGNGNLPGLMFKRNMLSQVFREDEYTWDVAATENNTEGGTVIEFNLVDLESSILTDRLTSVKIMPFKKGFDGLQDFTGATVQAKLPGDTNTLVSVTYTADDNPILAMGDYRPRFNLKSTEGQTTLADPALFTPAFNGSGPGPEPFLTRWRGSEIVKINKTFQPLEIRGPYGRDLTTGGYVRGRSLANRYDPRAFHQIGLFGNSAYDETVTLTPEGYEDPAKINTSGGSDVWVFTSPSVTVERGLLKVQGPLELKHSLTLTAGAMYTVEFQVYSPVDGEGINLTFMQSSGVEDASVPVTLEKGLNSYRETIKPTPTFCPSQVCPSDVSFVFEAPGASADVRFKYLRLYPKEGEANTFVYNTRGNLVQRVDENNLSTYFDYDPFGNLITIRNDDGIAFSAQKRIYANREGVAR